MAQKLSLIADIGGPNARFALVENNSIKAIEPKSYPCADYPTIVEAIRAYLESVDLERPERAAIAIATPVTSDRIRMTNHTWDFSIKEVSDALGFNQLKVLNDYTALALALSQLTDEHYVKIGGGEQQPAQVKAVLGPGTGLGVSGAVPVNNSWVPLEGEGGHVTYGALNDEETKVIQLIQQKIDHVSAEVLVSGPGLSLIYQVLSELQGNNNQVLKPHEVTHKALDQADPIAIQALSMLCGVLGTVAGNLALTLGARGGVFIGGGVIPGVVNFFEQSSFRERFEDHGRFTQYLSEIPTYVINSAYPALIGASVSLKSEYQSIGVNSND